MKKLVSIVILVALMLPTLSKIAILVNFKMNQDFLEEMFCINKEVEMTICKASCYLADQLEKQEQKEAQIPNSTLEKVNLDYFAQSNTTSIPNAPFAIVNGIQSLYVEGYFYQNTTDIFHPPQLLPQILTT